MADISHRLPDATSEGRGSLFARMIPGTAGTLRGTNPPAVRKRISTSAPDHGVVDPSVKVPRTIRANHEPRNSTHRKWAQFLTPRPQVADRLVLYQLMILDLAVLIATSLLLAAIIPSWGLPLLTMPVYAVLVTLFGFREGLYKKGGAPVAEEFPVLARSASFSMVLVVVAEWNSIQPYAPLTTLAISLAALMLWRPMRAGWNEHCRATESRKVLIVGAGPAGCAIARALGEDPLHTSTVVGFVDDRVPLSPKVLGRIKDLDWLARAQFIDEVILAVPNEPKLVRAAAEVAFRNRLDIRAVPDLRAGHWPEASVERLGGIPVIALHRETLPNATLLLKCLLDVVGAVLGLALISPVMALLALLIRLDSRGPALYSAERTGAKGRPFRCYKLRSMAAEADQLKETLRGRNQRHGPIFKLVDDPRITRFGKFLRRYSLDELPQLWNVLRGDMSLVGPRPHPVEEVNCYQLHHCRRLDMKPGITGLWQITARNDPSFDLNMHLDLTCIENWTLSLDLRILALTARVLFAPEGA
jgi:exopolysaccharide biosynthesis polyprenyl glycosylphosphotransferase